MGFSQRRIRVWAALGVMALAVVVLAAGLVGCAGTGDGGSPTASAPPESPGVTVGMSYIPNVQFAPFYVAEAQGLFTRQDVQATLRHHGSDEGLFTAIGVGEEQFVVASGDEALQAREQGVDLVAIASYYREYPVRVIARDDAGIATLADLRGKKIGVPGRYGESWFGLLVALKSAGLGEDDVRIEEIGYTQQAALASGKVDAAIGFVNNDLVQDQLAGLSVTALPLTAKGEPPLVSACLLTTRAFLDAHPDQAKAVAQAMTEGVAATAADPAAALTATKDWVPSLSQADQEAAAKATLRATIGIMTDDSGKASGKLDETQWKAMSDFMVSVGLLKKPADLAAAMDVSVMGE